MRRWSAGIVVETAAVAIALTACGGARSRADDADQAVESRVIAARAALMEVPFPIPPLQREAWSPPPGLPDGITASVRALAALGLADPRGCEYREVELRVATGPARFGVHRSTHAWVIPARGAA